MLRPSRSLPTWWWWAMLAVLFYAAVTKADTVHQAGVHIYPFGQARIGPVPFTDLPFTPCPSGQETYCNDCTRTTVCAGGGTGAWALCLNGTWSCTAGAPSNPATVIGIPPTANNQLAVWNDPFAIGLKGAANPANCTSGQASAGIDEFGVAEGCFNPSFDPTDASNTFNQKLVGYRQAGGLAAAAPTVIVGSGAVGLIPQTISGTPVYYSDNPDGSWISYTPGAITNNIAGHNVTGANLIDMRMDSQTVGMWVMKTGAALGDITDVRILVGYRSAILSAAVGDEDPGSVASMMFRCSTAAGDTTWKTKTRDDDTVALNETLKDTGVTCLVQDTKFVFTIDVRNSESVDFYINGALVTNHAPPDFLPTVTDLLASQWKIHNLDGAAGHNPAIRWKRYYQVSN